MKIEKRTLAALLIGMACTGVSYAADPIAEWNFDAQTLANSGTTVGEHDGMVVQGAATNATLQTAVFSTNTPFGSGYALDLSTEEDYMIVTNSSTDFEGYVSTFDAVTDFSYSMWVKSSDGTWDNWDEFASKGSEDDSEGWTVRGRQFTAESSKDRNGAGVSFFGVGTAKEGGYNNYPYTDIMDQEWHQLTFTYDSAAASLTFYIDGSAVATNTAVTAMNSTIGNALTIGARSDGTRRDSVLVDEVLFYDTVLSSSDVFSLYVDQTSVSVDADEIDLKLISPETAVTGGVAVSYISEFDIDVDVSISNASHSGFSVLTAVPLTMTEPSPSNTSIEIEFDQTLAGAMTNGEIASCTAVIAWNRDGDAEVTEILVPVSVEYIETIEKGTPVLWDISKSSDGNDIPSTYADFVAAGVTEDIDGADVSNVDGAQNMSDGFITVDLSAYKDCGIDETTYTGDGAAVINEYVYTKYADAVITIGGLNGRLAEDTEYCLYLWGIGNDGVQNATFTYDEVSITTSTNNPFTADATNFMAKFSFTTDAVVADTIEVQWDRDASEAYTAFNGFAIVPKYSLAPAVGDLSIEIISSGTKAVLTFETDSGSSYGVQAKSLLTDSGWTSIADSIDGTGGDVSVTNTLGDDPEFYRAYIEE